MYDVRIKPEGYPVSCMHDTCSSVPSYQLTEPLLITSYLNPSSSSFCLLNVSSVWTVGYMSDPSMLAHWSLRERERERERR